MLSSVFIASLAACSGTDMGENGGSPGEGESVGEAVEPFTFYCKQVVANTLTVWSASTGYNGVHTLKHGDIFDQRAPTTEGITVSTT